MAGEDLTADEIAERLMKMLDTKDPGARKLAAVSSATVDKGPSVSRMKLDSLLTLQNVNRLLQFVRANASPGLSFEFTPAYQTMAQDIREALLNKASCGRATIEALIVLHRSAAAMLIAFVFFRVV